MEGMKALIQHEVNVFQKEVRAHAQARHVAQLRPVDRCARERSRYRGR